MPFIHPVYILCILVAISVHEWAHAVTAHRLGDPTPEHAGRLTLNPIAHIDPLGALLFLLVGFGWAKPVPVNPYFLRNSRRDMALVALAGPASNLAIATAAVIALAVVHGVGGMSSVGLLSFPDEPSVLREFLLQFLRGSVFVNLALMAFNLLPIAPLDGSKIVEPFVPREHRDTYEAFMQRGPIILLALIVLESFLPVPIISRWVYGIMDAVLSLFSLIPGL